MTRSRTTRGRVRGWLRVGALAGVLGVAGLVVPSSQVHDTEVVLVKVARAQGVALDDETTWILGVGSDARPGQDMMRSRGDALQLIGMNTRTGAATTIGIPRDSWVPIPGYGSNRVNAALYYGGPQLLAATVGDLVGVQPDYVFVTRFPFFENMVNDIGGIHVDNPRPFDDVNLKDNGFRSGRIHLDGYSAMAFSRIRKSLAGGDFDRSANQQRVLRGIQARVSAQAGERGFLERGVLTVLQHTATQVPPAELFRLAQAVAQVDPAKITNCVVQGSIGNVGPASVVFPNVSDARRYGDLARDDATLESC